MDSTPIERRSGLTRLQFLQEYLIPRKPVVLTDAFDGQALLDTWTLDYFKERFGTLLVNPIAYQAGFTRAVSRQFSLADYVRSIQQDTWQQGWPAGYGAPYLERWGEFDPLWGQRARELETEYQTPLLFADRSAILPKFLRGAITLQLFIGPAGTIVWLHRDSCMTHAWSCNITGRKLWLMYPPHQRKLVYDQGGRSAVHPEQPDYRQFPLFRDVPAITATNGPGETVFIPAGWFHYVRSLEPTISLSGNFIDHNFSDYLTDWARSGMRIAYRHMRSWVRRPRSVQTA